MTTNSNLTRSFKVQFSVDITGPAKKPTGKGKPSFKLVVFSLAVFAALISLGTAAFVRDPSSFPTMVTVWTEIKPVLVLLLQFLLK
jgi:hypothetical protein